MIAAFFNGKNIKERYEKKNSYLTMFNSIIVNSEDIKSDPFLSEISDNTISFLKPFHWDLEFPEVFNKNRGLPRNGAIILKTYIDEEKYAQHKHHEEIKSHGNTNTYQRSC